MSDLSMLLGLIPRPALPETKVSTAPAREQPHRDRLKEGQTIGGALILERVSEPGLPAGQTFWRCRCSCGLEFERLEWWLRLHSGCNAIRCGTACADRSRRAPPQDLTGKRFGALVIIGKRQDVVPGRGTVWEYRCDCGNIGYRPTRELNSRGPNQRCSKACSCSKY